MFNTDQINALNAPLSAGHVKTREQGGRQVAYIEGWHAIAEANRIFGFGAWSREAIETKCVSEREREIGARKDKGWGVTYVVRVRITVGDVTRDGCGAGHGIDRDLGQAHESAIKEAETDAMKRALMTFGNPFGLALYDKSQANVAPEIDESVSRFIAACEKHIAGETDYERLGLWWNSDEQKTARRNIQLSTDDVAVLKQKVLDRRAALKPKEAA